MFRGTGFSTGTLHAYQYCPLLLQLLFALVPNHEILPDSTDWWRRIVGGDEDINIFATVVTCITSCLDFYFVSTKRCFDDESTSILFDLTGGMRAHLLLLFTMRCLLINKLMNANIPEETLKKKIFQAIKPHLCEHYPDNIKKYGALVTVCDTQVTEKELQYVCKDVFEQTSKTYKNLQVELLGAFLKNMRAADLRQYADRCRAARNDDVPAGRPETPDYHDFKTYAADKWDLCDFRQGRSWVATDRDMNVCSGDSVHNLIRSNDEFIRILMTTKAIQSAKFKTMQRRIGKEDLIIKTYKGVTIFNSHHVTDEITNEATKNERFTLHCNGSYKTEKVAISQTKPVYSFIEVKYSSGECSYCQVMAIVRLVHGDDEEILLIVCRLELLQISPLAYPLYRYECVENKTLSTGYQLCCDVISVGSEFRPCIAHRYDLRASAVSSKIDRFRGTYQFFVIPYDRVGKTPNTNWPSDTPKDLYSRDSRRGLSLTLLPSREEQSTVINNLGSAAVEAVNVHQLKRARIEPSEECNSDIDSVGDSDSENAD